MQSKPMWNIINCVWSATRLTSWIAYMRCVYYVFLLAPIRQNYYTKETYGRVKIPFGPINQIISHWFQLPGARLEWPPLTSRGKRYKTPKTTHWHNCSLTTWLFIPHYAVAAAEAKTNSLRWRIPISGEVLKFWHTSENVHFPYLKFGGARRALVREASHIQNGWIFGKVPNGLWSPLSFSENHIAIFFRNSWPTYSL